jgi:hypothetical protein
MEKGHYPEYAIQELKKVNKRLEQEFQIVWGALSPSPERDAVMWHIMTARKKINEIVEGNENG